MENLGDTGTGAARILRAGFQVTSAGHFIDGRHVCGSRVRRTLRSGVQSLSSQEMESKSSPPVHPAAAFAIVCDPSGLPITSLIT